MNRVDLARKEYLYAKSHDADSIPLRIIEACIGLVSGGTPPFTVSSAYHLYNEQAAAPGSSSNPNVMAAKGVTYLLRGHYSEAESMFNEALLVNANNDDAIIGLAVAKQLGAKQGDADKAFQYEFFSCPS